MQRLSLFPKVRKEMQALLNGYIRLDAVTTSDGVAKYVTPSTWGNGAGMVGALTLAKIALEEASGGRPSAAATAKKWGAVAVAVAAVALLAFRRAS